MARAVVLSRPATRSLKRMPTNVSRLIRSKLDQLGADPNALESNVKPLKGTDAFRLRVGDWRVIFTVEPDRIVIEEIGPRGSIYD